MTTMSGAASAVPLISPPIPLNARPLRWALSFQEIIMTDNLDTTPSTNAATTDWGAMRESG
jgi:hypothetical protein